MFFSLFCYYLPLEKSIVLHLNKLESPSLKNALCQILLILAHWFWRRRFLNFDNATWILIISLSWEKWHRSSCCSPSHNPNHFSMLCIKFGWNYVNGSEDEEFDISTIYFQYFAIISTWKRAGFLNLNKSPSAKDALCQLWFKLVPCFRNINEKCKNVKIDDDDNKEGLQTDFDQKSSTEMKASCMLSITYI